MKDYGVIFDLDGTLWDVADTTTESANEISKKYGLPPISRETVCNTFGLAREGSARLFFPDLPLEQSMKLIDEVILTNIDKLFVKGGHTYPGLIDALKVLCRKYKLFIVSNSPYRRYVKSFVYSSNTAEFFTDYFSAGELGLTKSDTIKKVIKDNRLLHAIYVGDTELDYLSSVDAGINFVYADYGFGTVSNPQYSISSLYELNLLAGLLFSKY